MWEWEYASVQVCVGVRVGVHVCGSVDVRESDSVAYVSGSVRVCEYGCESACVSACGKCV